MVCINYLEVDIRYFHVCLPFNLFTCDYSDFVIKRSREREREREREGGVIDRTHSYCPKQKDRYTYIDRDIKIDRGRER